jgi:hypothetical protein
VSSGSPPRPGRRPRKRHRGTDSRVSRVSASASPRARANQFPNARGTPRPRPLEEVQRCSGDARLSEPVVHVLHGRIRTEGAYDGVPRGGVELDPRSGFVVDVGTGHWDSPSIEATGRSSRGFILSQRDRGTWPVRLTGQTKVADRGGSPRRDLVAFMASPPGWPGAPPRVRRCGTPPRRVGRAASCSPPEAPRPQP